MGRTRTALASVSELKQKIRLAKEKKKHLELYLQNIKKSYVKGEISQSFYFEKIRLLRNGKTIEEWIKHHENRILWCQDLIKKRGIKKNEAKKNKIKKSEVKENKVKKGEEELNQKIRLAKEKKRHLELYLQNLKKSYAKGEVSQNFYFEKVRFLHNGKTIEEWIKNHKDRILEYQGRVKKNEINKKDEEFNRIRLAKEKKRHLELYLENLNESYRKREISYSFYLGKIRLRHNGKTIEQWIKYYDNQILEHQDLIKKNRRESINKNLVLLIISSLFLLLIFGLGFYIQPGFTGSAVQAPGEISEVISEANVTIETIQRTAVLGQPVKWEKIVSLDSIKNVTIKLPANSEKISVKFSEEINQEVLPKEDSSPSQEEPSSENKTEEFLENANNENITIVENATEENVTITENVTKSNLTDPESVTESNLTITENVTKKNITESNLTAPEDIIKPNITDPENTTEKNTTITTNGSNSEEINQEVLPKEDSSPSQEEPSSETNVSEVKFSITGSAISETAESKSFLNFFRNIFRLTGKVIGIEEQQDTIEVTIEENTTEYKIEYETPAPYAVEEDIERGKRVKIIGPETVHYKNVLSFTTLPENLNIRNPSQVIIRWVEQGELVPIQNIQDKDNNGIYDYIEWLAPSLSEQTFEIIVIIKADHLDSDREFISNIYEEVKEQDDVWSETIPSEDYVRVTFERALDNTKDITIYPRTVSGTPKIEIYEVDGTELIAEFTAINDNEYNKIFLTNFIGEQDTFDLRIVGGSVEFDHIIDPTLSDDMDVTLCFVADSKDATCNAISNFNDGNLGTSGATVEKSGIIYLPMDNTTGLTADSTINLVNLSLYHDSDSGVSGAWTILLTEDTNSSPTTYCSDNTITHITTPQWDYWDLTSCTTWTKTNLDDLRVEMRSGDEAGSTDSFVFELDINVSFFTPVPSFNNPQINETGFITPGMNINHSINVTQSPSEYLFSWNASGASCDTWVNSSWTTVSGGFVIAHNSSEIPSACLGETIGWRFYGNNSGGVNSSSIQEYFVNGPPQWSENSTNSTVAGEYILHSVNWTDDLGLSGYIFEFDNGTGTFTNDSFLTFTGTQNWSNVSKVVNATVGSTIRWRVYSNDSFNGFNSTDLFQYTTTVPTPPQWSDDSTNGTDATAGTYILHSVNWTDDTALSGYIFEFDNGTGTFANDSFVTFSGTQNWSNVSKVVNTTGGSTIRWRVYSNDSTNQINSTDIFQYTIISFGTLNVDISLPTDNTNVIQNETFFVNATITCSGSAGDVCGTVEALARYNGSGATPDTAINTTAGDVPLYTIYTGYGNPVHEWNATDTNGVFTGDIDIDDSGFVYVTGSNGELSYYTVKYHGNNGTIVWNFTDFTGDIAEGIAVDSTGNFVYVSGRDDGTFASYTKKYHAGNGTTVWGVSDTNNAIGYDVAIDGSGFVYVVGYNSTNNYYTAKYHGGNGTIVWNVTDSNGFRAQGVAVDSSGFVYVTGRNFTSTDWYTVKYHGNNGTKIWGVEEDIGGISYGVTVDDSGFVYVTGNDSTGYYTVKYHAGNGTQVWNVTDTNGVKARGIDVDSSGFVYVTGQGGSTDYYTVKYNNSGGQVWNITDTNGNSAKGIAVDNFGFVHIMGTGDSNNYYTVKYSQEINPKTSSETLEAGEEFLVNWTVNATGTPGTSYEIDVLFNSTTYYPTLAENDTEDRQVNIIAAAAGTAPTFTFIPNNISLHLNYSLEVDFNATDASGIDVFFINWTNNFTIDSSTGTLTNSSQNPPGTYLINVSVNDTLGNVNSTIYKLIVREARVLPTPLSLIVELNTSNGTAYGHELVWKNILAGTFDEFGGAVTENKRGYTTGKTTNESINAFHALNGSLIWTTLIGQSDGTPLIDEDFVYINVYNEVDSVTGVYKLWKSNGTIAAENHTCSGGSDINGTAHSMDHNTNLIFDGCGDGNLYAYNKDDLTVNWSYNAGAEISSTPLYFQDTVTFGTRSNSLPFMQVNATTGASIWNNSGWSAADKTWDMQPSTKDGVIYMSSGNGGTGIGAFHFSNGTLLWNRSELSGFFTQMAIYDDRLWAGSVDNSLYSFFLTNGSTACSFATGNDIYQGPAIVEDDQGNGLVLFSSRDSNAYLLNSTDCSQLWNYTIGDSFASPSVSEGLVYFKSDDTNIYAFDFGKGGGEWGTLGYDYDDAGKSFCADCLIEWQHVVTNCTTTTNTTCTVTNNYDHATSAVLNVSSTYSWYYSNGTVIKYNTENITLELSANSLENIVLDSNPTLGTLNVNISLPADNTNVNQNETFIINTNVTCEGVEGAFCGTVSGLARYNGSGATPNTKINATKGATPLYVVGSNGDLVQEWDVNDSSGNSGEDIAIDSPGNVYVFGRDGSNEYHTLKYHGNNGTHIWNVSDTKGNDAQGIAVDSDEGIYITGADTNFFSFWDFYTVKYNSSDGSQLWNVTDTIGSIAYDVAVDSSGFVYVTGGESSNYYTVKYHANNGTLVWNISDGDSLSNTAYGIAVDNNGGVYVTGVDDSFSDWYTTKYNATDGSQLWNVSDTFGDNGYDVAFDGSDSVYVTGDGNSGYYTVKYNASNGAHLWNVSDSLGSQAWGVAIDDSGGVYVSGDNTTNGYIVKYNSSDGSQLRNFFDVGMTGSKIAVDSINNIYVESNSGSSYYTVKYFQDNLKSSPQTLEQGESFLANWTINATGAIGTSYEIDALFNSTTYPSITGNDTEDRTITIGEGNTAPIIYGVTDISDVTLTDGPGATYITVNFSVNDSDGAADLDNSSAMLNLTKSGEELRLNSSCSPFQFGGNYANYTCNVTMWWYDGDGSDWAVYANITDQGNNLAINGTTTFTVNTLTGFVVSPSELSFSSLSSDSTNQTPSDFFVLNNTGNVDISSDNVQINATDLVGETSPGEFLFAGNFSGSNSTGGNIECNASNPDATALVNYSYTGIVGSILAAGNYTLGNGTGQENLYLCLREVGSELSQQQYSTNAFGSWTIRILLVAITPAKRRKKKKKLKKSNKILKLLTTLTIELKEEYSGEKEILIRKLMKAVQEEYGVKRKEILELIREKELAVPAAIFSKKLGALESLTKHMKENLNMNYKEIAGRLGRDERTVWTSYKKAKEKQPEPIKTKKTKMIIPLSIFKNKKLTVLESIIVYLKERRMKYSEIAEILDRDQRNIWTIYSRAMKKLEKT